MTISTLGVQNISKSFDGVRAIKDLSLELFAGQVHALLGENGAGKSTLVNILGGNIKSDSGSILYEGKEISITNPRISRDLGIAIVHQHPILFPDLSVRDNIMLSQNPLLRKTRNIDWVSVERQAAEKMERLGVELSLNSLAKELSSADGQMLEIVKALTDDTKVLVLDEPTSALSNREVKNLMIIIEKAKANQVAILLISHRLDEIFAIADHVTVARDGVSVTTGPISEFSQKSAVEFMIGKPITSLYPKAVTEIGAEVLKVQEISCKGSFRNISFSLRKGEILGLAGLVGSGRSEIAKSIFGIDSFDSGTILLDGEKYEPDSPAEAVIKGITLVPEDRTNEGIILEQNIQFNSTLVILDSHSKYGIVKSKVNQDLADSMITDFGIRTSGRNQMVSALSGGNQQKVVIGKWLASQPRIVILDDPTRGVDVGAKSEVYKIVAKLIESGVSVILISNDLEELVNVCDRIISLYKGEIIEEFKSRPFDSEKILSSMTLGAINA